MAINDNSFIGGIPFFLNAILSTPAGALPKGPLWVVAIDFDNNLRNTIRRVKDYEPRMPEPWDIDQALNTITTKRFQEEKGCVLTQSVTVPGESLITVVDGLQYNGYIRSRVGNGRQDFEPLRVSFLNTNVSFVDNVVRPWTVMTGHLGLIARPAREKYRTSITIYKLGIERVDRPPFVLQQYNFWGCCPINVSGEDYTYAPDSAVMTRSADFIYQWYTTTSTKNRFAIGSVPDLRGTVSGTDAQGNVVTNGSVARAIIPDAPVEVRRGLSVDAPGPFPFEDF